MEALLLIAVIAGVVLVGLLLLGSANTTRPPVGRYDSPECDEGSPRRNPCTGEWEDWDGTPYGAIDTLLMEDDPDRDWDGVSGQGPWDDWA